MYLQMLKQRDDDGPRFSDAFERASFDSAMGWFAREEESVLAPGAYEQLTGSRARTMTDFNQPWGGSGDSGNSGGSDSSGGLASDAYSQLTGSSARTIEDQNSQGGAPQPTGPLAGDAYEQLTGSPTPSYDPWASYGGSSYSDYVNSAAGSWGAY